MNHSLSSLKRGEGEGEGISNKRLLTQPSPPFGEEREKN
jgi:hypothetical protein